jgi:hypothetical protein
MKPLSEFCCINAECSEHGKRCGKNLRVHQRYGKSDTIRLLECKVCRCVVIVSQKEPTQSCQEVVPAYVGRRSSPYFITLLKAVDNVGSDLPTGGSKSRCC